MTKDITPQFEIIPFSDLIQITDNFGKQISGWRTDSNALVSNKVRIDSSSERILIGNATAPLTGVGIFMGSDGANGYDLRSGNPSGNYFHWDESEGTVTVKGTIIADDGTIGGFDIGTDYVRDTANSFGLSSVVTSGDDIRFWAGATFANKATAPFRVTEAGSVTASSITITGGSILSSLISGTIAQSNLNIANRGWVQTCIFSVTDADTIAWGTGTFTSADGTAYSISAGNTVNMVAKTYIYLDIVVSTTVYQITTTATNAVGAGKVMVATAQNGTTEATYQVLQGQGGQNIDAANIVVGSITANEIATSTITAANISTLLMTGKQCIFDTGYFGGSTNGIQLNSDGLEIIGSGYIRTAASGARIEIVKNLGGLTNAIALYDASNLLFRISDTGLQMFNTGRLTTDVAAFTIANAYHGISITTTGSAARTGKAALNIANNSDTGQGLRMSQGDGNAHEMIYMAPATTNNPTDYVLRLAAPTYTPDHEARITKDGYLQFPAYYHCSDFDEKIAGSTALTSTVIAKAYWTGGGTSGTQTLETGQTEDESTYVKLSTTSTANRSSTLTFGRSLNPLSTRADVEFRIRVSAITNTAVKIGLYSDATHYYYFLFDTAVDANNIYIASKDGAGDETTVDTNSDLDNNSWKTFRIKTNATTVYYYIDDVQVGSAYTTQKNDPRTPYFYVDNKAAAEEKILYVDYVKIWQGRDDGQSPT